MSFEFSQFCSVSELRTRVMRSLSPLHCQLLVKQLKLMRKSLLRDNCFLSQKQLTKKLTYNGTEIVFEQGCLSPQPRH